MNTETNTASAPAAQGQRKRWLAIVIGAFALCGIAYGAYWAMALRYVQTTDDAYVSGNVVQITPQIAGTVVGIGADDTQFVKAGQTLIQLDPADAKIALEQADAKLGKTVSATCADCSRRRRNQGQCRRALDVARAKRGPSAGASASASSGAVSGEELRHARTRCRARMQGWSRRSRAAANQAPDQRPWRAIPTSARPPRRFMSVSRGCAHALPAPVSATLPSAPCSSANASRQAHRSWQSFRLEV
jgi:membrane fusion protein (multidrug efflux system)